MSITVEASSKNTSLIPALACVVTVAAGVVYGKLAYGWDQSDYFLLLAPLGVILGSFWSGTFYRRSWGVAAAVAGASGVPIAMTFC